MTLVAQLAEAQAAYHALQIGRATVRIQDVTGEMIIYNQANASQLASYIAELQRKIDGPSAVKSIQFQTSKGI